MPSVYARAENGATHLRGAKRLLSARLRCAPVAQLDRASDYESEGRTFESFRARHFLHHEPPSLRERLPSNRELGRRDGECRTACRVADRTDGPDSFRAGTLTPAYKTAREF